MADQKINELPTKTSPAAGDKALMSGAAEEYLIDYDQLANAILNKLTSKTFSLDQGTKTLVAALNELNSKTAFLSISDVESGTSIDDLPNSIFLVASSRITGNIPTGLASWMFIITSTYGSSTGVQFITSLFSGSTAQNSIYKRSLTNSSWGDWVKIN